MLKRQYKHEELTLREELLPVVSLGSVLGHPVKIRLCELLLKYNSLTAAQMARILRLPPANTYKLVNSMVDEHILSVAKSTRREVYLQLNAEYITKSLEDARRFLNFQKQEEAVIS